MVILDVVLSVIAQVPFLGLGLFFWLFGWVCGRILLTGVQDEYSYDIRHGYLYPCYSFSRRDKGFFEKTITAETTSKSTGTYHPCATLILSNKLYSILIISQNFFFAKQETKVI